jgi:hypothetical protein
MIRFPPSVSSHILMRISAGRRKSGEVSLFCSDLVPEFRNTECMGYKCSTTDMASRWGWIFGICTTQSLSQSSLASGCGNLYVRSMVFWHLGVVEFQPSLCQHVALRRPHWFIDTTHQHQTHSKIAYQHHPVSTSSFVPTPT